MTLITHIHAENKERCVHAYCKAYFAKECLCVLNFEEIIHNSYLRASNFSTNLWSENLKLEALPTILSFLTKDWIEKLEARM